MTTERFIRRTMEDRGYEPDEIEESRAPEVYCVERTGDIYQSVFPSAESELSQLHSTVQDALDYFQEVKPGVHVEVPDELA